MKFYFFALIYSSNSLATLGRQKSTCAKKLSGDTPMHWNQYQWRIQGFSWGRGRQLPKSYYLANILLKTAWKWKNLDRVGNAGPWIRQWVQDRSECFNCHSFTSWLTRSKPVFDVIKKAEKWSFNEYLEARLLTPCLEDLAVGSQKVQDCPSDIQCYFTLLQILTRGLYTN